MAAALPRLETLYERPQGSPLPLPDALRQCYGGQLSFPVGAPHVFANFVSTIDGLVSFGLPGLLGAATISKGNAGDRAVMGILRAAADVVVAGAGTLRAEPRVTWTPRQVFPKAADLFAEMRRARGLPPRTRVAIVSASGDVDISLGVFHSPDVEPLIVTSVAGAERLAGRTRDVPVRAVGEREPTMRQVIDAVVAETGARLILSEAGPTLFGRMLAEHVVDELFLTLSPHVAGRSEERRGMSLVEPTAFHPERAPWADLLGVKRSDDYLLLRYAFRR
ncbi:MAG: dihydrofolate reductase family protein [Chloroflexota bacterium]|nr:dihydrofolate reductase family protein [Chloroflexota bacterium]MDE3101214.1 dihydrofolate reductase family protein [Chloroflexota bacterium]